MDVLEPTAVAADRARRAREHDEEGDASDSPALRPRTGTVLGLLVTAALVLSYFVAFPLNDALRAAEVLAAPAAAGYDPRLRWMATSFVTLLCGAAVTAGVFRLMSRRQLRSIDAMADTE